MMTPDVEAMHAHAGDIAQTLKLLANRDRLLLLCRVSRGETSVGALVEHSNLGQSSVSQHLARLRAGGLVRTRRDGATIFYSAADAWVHQLVASLCERFVRTVPG